MPISTPFTAGIDMIAAPMRPSSLRSHDTCDPRPTGKPSTTTSQMPPSVFPARLISSIFSIIRCSASASSVRSGDSSAAALMFAGISAGRSASMPPRCTTWLPMQTSNSRRNRLQIAAAATRAVVSRADARSRMSRASSRSYLSRPVRSAWPGRTRVTARLRGVPGSTSGAGFMISSQFFQSRLRISIAIGAPIVSPARTPERNSTASFSICIRRPRPYPC